MPANPKNIVSGEKLGFTLIELIIVVVIIAILAMVAIPRYFANVAKAQKAQVYTNLKNINEALQGYYAAYGVYPADNAFPIIVTVDGDAIMQVADPDPTGSKWAYEFSSQCCACPSAGSNAYKEPGSSCNYCLCVDGRTLGTSCTP